MSVRSDHPVAVVTGGGGGIGAAIAIELGRRGAHVVTVDPMVTVDGREAADGGPDHRAAEATTAAQIVAAGGSAEASPVSVTDRAAVDALFGRLLAERGRVDAVVNVAGITRPTGFASGTDEDWSAVLAVHLHGYVNLLRAAMPLMAEAGSGRIVGVTSGSGWRAADAGAYSCAKRAVAALTWQLGAVAPEGVGVNAISPIAMTRMVAAAMQRARAAAAPAVPGSSASESSASGPGASGARRRATGGLSLGGMPAPTELGPLGAHLAMPGASPLRGQVLFAGGSEVALVRPPRILEAVRTSDPTSAEAVLGSVLDSWVAAEQRQATTGGANPRFAGIYDGARESSASTSASASASASASTVAARVWVVGEGRIARRAAARLAERGDAVALMPGNPADSGVDATVTALKDAAAQLGGLDAVIVVDAASEHPALRSRGGWADVVDDHAGLAMTLARDARWSRAVAAHSVGHGSLRLVQVVDARTSGGRSRAQALTQLARAAHGATDERVSSMVVSLETDDPHGSVVTLLAMLATEPRSVGLSGAELVVGDGWVGLRSHPAPAGSLVYGGPDLPPWFDDVLIEMNGSGS